MLYNRVVKLMGNRFEFTIQAENQEQADACLDAAITEVKRLETLLTTFSPDSQTNQVNEKAGICPVEVDREVFELIKRANRISSLTQGAFDISFGSVDKRLWNFDTTLQTLPDPAVLKVAVRLVNYKNIILDDENSTVFLKEKGMRIGFGGIGKGYAAERARSVLLSLGIDNGIVNAAGDLTTWGNQPNGQPWTIGIADPVASTKPFSTLKISNAAVATSGDYEKYITIAGKRYSHTINPKTGMPVAGIKSVTIICPNAELADALATPVMVMGVKVGLDLINQMQHLACIIIDENDVLHHSKNINLN